MAPSEITKLDQVRSRGLRDTSFTEDDSEVKERRLIIALDGESGSGKNKLLFSFPDPIAFMSFDPNYGKALKEAREAGKIIYHAKYSLPVIVPDGKDGSKISKAMGEVWDQFAVDFMGAVRDPEVETIGIDTGTELYELIVYAIYGKNVQIMPKDRGHAYAAYRQVVREVENSSKNLVLLHKMRDEWVADKSTGKRIRAGYKETSFLCPTEILLEKNSEEPFPSKKDPFSRYHAYIVKSHLRPEIEYDGNGNGQLDGEMIGYDALAELIFS